MAGDVRIAGVGMVPFAKPGKSDHHQVMGAGAARVALKDAGIESAELGWQLRGQAGAQQVDGASIAMQHNLGLGGACVVSLCEKVN